MQPRPLLKCQKVALKKVKSKRDQDIIEHSSGTQPTIVSHVDQLLATRLVERVLTDQVFVQSLLILGVILIESSVYILRVILNEFSIGR